MILLQRSKDHRYRDDDKCCYPASSQSLRRIIKSVFWQCKTTYRLLDYDVPWCLNWNCCFHEWKIEPSRPTTSVGHQFTDHDQSYQRVLKIDCSDAWTFQNATNTPWRCVWYCRSNESALFHQTSYWFSTFYLISEALWKN